GRSIRSSPPTTTGPCAESGRMSAARCETAKRLRTIRGETGGVPGRTGSHFGSRRFRSPCLLRQCATWHIAIHVTFSRLRIALRDLSRHLSLPPPAPRGERPRHTSIATFVPDPAHLSHIRRYAASRLPVKPAC